MKQTEIGELLCKQLELLAERSKKFRKGRLYE